MRNIAENSFTTTTDPTSTPALNPNGSKVQVQEGKGTQDPKLFILRLKPALEIIARDAEYKKILEDTKKLLKATRTLDLANVVPANVVPAIPPELRSRNLLTDYGGDLMEHISGNFVERLSSGANPRDLI